MSVQERLKTFQLHYVFAIFHKILVVFFPFGAASAAHLHPQHAWHALLLGLWH
jgi:hypothetical protein